MTSIVIVVQALLALLANASAQRVHRIPIGAILGPEDSSVQRSLHTSFGHEGQLAREGISFDLFVENADFNDPYALLQAATRLVKRHSVLTILVPTLTPGLSWMCHHRHLPLVSLRASSLPSNTPMAAVEISPDPLLPIIDIMRFYKWASLHYVYQDDDGLHRLQNLQQTGSNALGIHSWHLHRFENPNQARDLLLKLDVAHSRTRVFVILDLDPDFAARVLSDLSKATYIEKSNFHILLAQPMDDIFWKETYLKTLSVSGFQLYEPTSLPEGQDFGNSKNLYGSTTQWVLADDAVLLLQYAFNRLSDKNPFVFRSLRNSTYGRNISEPLQYGELLISYIRDTYLSKSSTSGSALQFDSKGKRRGFMLNILETTPTIPVKAFTWSDATGLAVISPNFIQRGKETGTKTLIISTVLGEPYLKQVKGNRTKGNVRYEGYLKDLVEFLSLELGFKYELKPVADGKYGTQTPDGKWTGMIGEVMRHEADMAVAPLTITTERQTVVDMSTPFMTVGITLLIRKPDSSGMGSLAPGSAYFFLSPFAADVWGCLLVALVLVGVTHFGIGRLLTKANPSSVLVDISSGGSSSLLDSIWFAFGSLFLRQTGLLPKSFSSRVLSGIWWVFAFFVLSLYVTSLVCLLVTSEMGTNGLTREEALARKSAADIIQESVKTGYPAIGCVSLGSTRAFFANSRQPLYLKYSRLLDSHPEWMSTSYDEGIKRVKEGQGAYAYLMESSMNEYITLRECDVMMVPQLLDSKGYGIVTAKGSPLSDPLNRGLLVLAEKGEFQRLYNKWWSSPTVCPSKDSGKKLKDLYHSSMTLSDVAGVFYFLVAGFLFTLMVSFGEILHSRRSDRGIHRVALTNVSPNREIIHYSVGVIHESDPPSVNANHHSSDNSSVNANDKRESNYSNEGSMYHERTAL